MVEQKLLDEILNEMTRLGYAKEDIDYVRSAVKVEGNLPVTDRTTKASLILVFYNILMSGETIPPTQIRLALNVAKDMLSWLDDMKLVILPFILTNREKFKFG